MTSNQIRTIEQLETFYPLPPAEGVLAKELDHLPTAYAEMVRSCTLAVLTTAGPRGLDLTPLGGKAGFIVVHDEHTLLIPDAAASPVDGARNVLSDRRTGLLFLIPGMGETLRVHGIGMLSVAPELLAHFDGAERKVKTVLAVRVKTAYFQCSKSIARAQLWRGALPPESLAPLTEGVKKLSHRMGMRDEPQSGHTLRSMAQIDTVYERKDPKPPLSLEFAHLPKAFQTLIGCSSFLVIGSSGKNGLDASPRGGLAGFVAVEDTRTLLIPDFAGNNRLDTMRNLLDDPRVSLLFFVPGYPEVLRVRGIASIDASEDMRQRFKSDDTLPRSVMVVDVQSAILRSSRALTNAKFWRFSQIDRASAMRALTALTAFWKGLREARAKAREEAAEAIRDSASRSPAWRRFTGGLVFHTMLYQEVADQLAHHL